MLTQSWALYMDPFMVLMMESFRDYFLEVQWSILVLKCLALMKVSNCEYLLGKCLAI